MRQEVMREDLLRQDLVLMRQDVSETKGYEGRSIEARSSSNEARSE